MSYFLILILFGPCVCTHAHTYTPTKNRNWYYIVMNYEIKEAS